MTRRRGYAHGTRVEIARTRSELETLLRKHGAAQILTGVDHERAEGMVGFTLGGRQYRMRLPPRDGQGRNPEQVHRERWRALLLLTKAKLEFVASGMGSVEREFLSAVVLPNGATLGETIEPQLAEAYASGVMPRLLPPS